MARVLGPEVTLIAPDLRGRGRSGDLPGPFGMRAHAEDLSGVLDHLDVDRAVLAGHSMGAYVATTAATIDPKRWSSVVLVDGGVPLPLPDGVDPDAMLAGVLGPALARLEMTFESRGRLPRRSGASTRPSRSRARGTPTPRRGSTTTSSGTAPTLRSSASLEAVRSDGRELLVNRPVRNALFDLEQPTVLLRAPRGLLNQVPPLLPDELLDPLRSRWPDPSRDAGREHEPLLDRADVARGPGDRLPPARRLRRAC